MKLTLTLLFLFGFVAFISAAPLEETQDEPVAEQEKENPDAVQDEPNEQNDDDEDDQADEDQEDPESDEGEPETDLAESEENPAEQNDPLPRRRCRYFIRCHFRFVRRGRRYYKVRVCHRRRVCGYCRRYCRTVRVCHRRPCRCFRTKCGRKCTRRLCTRCRRLYRCYRRCRRG